MQIVRMTAAHADAVLRIYQAGIDSGLATFETRAPSWAELDASRLPDHRYVALDEVETVLGWVAVTRVSPREAYAGVVEHSVYVATDARGHGIGSVLLEWLIASTEAAGIWTIQSSIFPDNPASIALHERAGFRQVGVRERIARRDGAWRDVVLLERRSSVVN